MIYITMARRTNKLGNLARETESHFPAIFKKEKKRITKATKDTAFYRDIRNIQLEGKDDNEYKTEVYVVNDDTIDAAYKLQQEGLRPVVLNMASAWRPGGGWRKGARAQEESLFYRSTYAISLEDCLGLDKEREWSYPLPLFGAVYSPDIYIFRGNAKERYPLYDWDHCCWMDFMAVAAVRKPKLTKDNHLQEEDKSVMMNKIEGMFRIAQDKKHDSLVLGAWGSGAYSCPPRDVALLFKEAIKPYMGKFKRIVFAILDDRNTGKKHNPEGNLSVYQDIFPHLLPDSK